MDFDDDSDELPAGDVAQPGGMAYFGYRLAVTAKLFDRRFAALLMAHSDLTLPQWRCLAQLGLAEPGTVRSLADGAAVDRAEVSRSLARLVEQGLVNRQDNADDQRSPHFTLTPFGKALFERLRAPVGQFVHGLIDPIAPEDMAAADRVLAAMARGCG